MTLFSDLDKKIRMFSFSALMVLEQLFIFNYFLGDKNEAVRKAIASKLGQAYEQVVRELGTTSGPLKSVHLSVQVYYYHILFHFLFVLSKLFRSHIIISSLFLPLQPYWCSFCRIQQSNSNRCNKSLQHYCRQLNHAFFASEDEDRINLCTILPLTYCTFIVVNEFIY